MTVNRNSPNSPPPLHSPPPFLENNSNWIALITPLKRGAPVCWEEVEAVGCMLAYAHQTNTEMLALPVNEKNGVYKLLFSFDSPDNMADFLRLLQLNAATAHLEIFLPYPHQIRSALPLQQVLPIDLVSQIITLAGVLLSYHE